MNKIFIFILFMVVMVQGFTNQERNDKISKLESRINLLEKGK